MENKIGNKKVNGIKKLGGEELKRARKIVLNLISKKSQPKSKSKAVDSLGLKKKAGDKLIPDEALNKKDKVEARSEFKTKKEVKTPEIADRKEELQAQLKDKTRQEKEGRELAKKLAREEIKRENENQGKIAELAEDTYEKERIKVQEQERKMGQKVKKARRLRIKKEIKEVREKIRKEYKNWLKKFFKSGFKGLIYLILLVLVLILVALLFPEIAK